MYKRQLHHGLVILDFEGVVLERMQLRQRDFPYFFQLGILAAFLSGKQVIVWSQLYFFRAAFQVLSLNDVMGTLTSREAKVLRLRFGLEDGKARTLEEVGKEFNVAQKD